MIKILSREESFALLNKKFKELQVNDVIDLTHDGLRYPAIVFNVYQRIRAFDVLPLTAENTDKLMRGNADGWLLGSIRVILLPDSADKVHPMWNVIPRS
jgi:hypothetical protein